MSVYDFYCLGSGGLDIESHSVDCSDDKAAVKQAHWILNKGGISEIWAESRSVAVVFVPLPAMSPASLPV